MRIRNNINTVIVEGCDGTGKSTLLTLDNFKNASIIHTGPPSTSNPYLEYAYQLVNGIAKPHRIATKAKPENAPNPVGIIFDRFHIGEFIYQPIFRSANAPFTIKHVRLIARILLGLGSSGIVFACPPLDVVKENFRKNKDNELPTNLDQITQIYLRYVEIMYTHEIHTGIPVQVYDYTSAENLESTLDFMHAVLNSRYQDSYDMNASDIRYLAVIDDDVIINPNKSTSTDIITDFLIRRSIPESQVGWINLREINTNEFVTTIPRLETVLRNSKTLILVADCDIRSQFVEFLRRYIGIFSEMEIKAIFTRCHYVDDWEEMWYGE